ncbi:MAG: hypothetical protein AABX11_05350 [Nanoarchaeota archaeon]
MKKGRLRVIGRVPSSENEGKIYEIYNFNKLDAYFRQEGFRCTQIRDLGDLQGILRELKDLIRGESYYMGKRVGDENIRGKLEDLFMIVPAHLVLEEDALTNLVDTNPFEKRPGRLDYYALYLSSKLKHSEYAQTSRWEVEKKKRVGKKN